MNSRIAVAGLFSLCACMRAADGPIAPRHIVVYKEAGRYGGWPANHGIWSWGNEIVAGFSAAYYQKKSADVHQYNSSKPEEPRLARSLDGGETWTIEAPPSLLPPEQGGAKTTSLREPMDFLHTGFAMTIRFTDTNQGPSRLLYSYDRCKTWKGPYEFPLLGSWIGEEPAGFAIMPSTVRLSADRMITAVRVKEDQRHDAIDLHGSADDGAHWQFLNRPVPSTGGHGGNPPSMIRLKDGRICLTYGYRGEPYRICARISKDEGSAWSEEIVLRTGATWELGYTRTVQRPDGKIVTVYYFPEHPDTERIIAATIWNP